jgi:hypothetical protein
VTTRLLRFAVVALAVAGCAQARAREHLQCSIELQAAESIVRFREQGRPKSFLTDMLPPRIDKPGAKPRPRHPTITSAMYSIIDEVYANPTIKLRAYVEYRGQTCVARTEKIKVPKSIADVALPMAGCQERFGNSQSPGLAECVKTLLEDYRKNKP